MSELNFTHSNGNKVKLATPSTLAANRTLTLPGNADRNIITSTSPDADRFKAAVEAAEELPFAFEELSGAAPALATVSVEEISAMIDTPKMFQFYFH